MEINFTAIIISLLFTIATYLGIPLLITKISKKELTPKRAKKIVIINAVCWWLFFRILNPGSTGAAAFLWGGIAYAILSKKCKEEPEEVKIEEQKTETPATTSTPSPQLSLSRADEPFKKYGDDATPANELMVQKQNPTEEKPRNQVYATLGSTQTTEQQSPSSKPLFCRKCGSQLLPDSAFCSKCGTKVETL